MSTVNDPMFEKRLTVTLRGVLEAENGPHPKWADSPAAVRIYDKRDNVRRLPSMRLLAIAAVLLVGGAAAAGALLSRPVTPVPMATDGAIAYSLNGAIYLVTPGESPRRIVGFENDGTFRACPSFIGDGRTLAFAQAPTHLVFAGLDEAGNVTGMRQLSVPGGLVGNCVYWSPDSASFAYVSPVEAGGNLSVATLDGGSTDIMAGAHWTPSTSQVAFILGPLAWSPDGSTIAIVKSSGTEFLTSELWLADVAGGQPRQLLAATTDESIHSVTWSPDGQAIAYGGTRLDVTEGLDASIDPEAHFVRTIAPDRPGDGVTSVDEIPVPASDTFDDGWSLFSGPVWSPDSNNLAWIRSGQTMVLDGETGTQTVLTPIELGKRAWASGPLVWSADGTRLLVPVLDESFLERFVESSVVIVDVAGAAPPIALLPWELRGQVDLGWQRIVPDAGAADLSAIPTVDPARSVEPPDPTPTPTPTAPPRQVTSAPN